MSDHIDAKGLGCAEPVLLARRSLKAHDEVTIVVDTRTSLENIKALAVYTGYAMEIAEEPGGIYSITLKKKNSGKLRDTQNRFKVRNKRP